VRVYLCNNGLKWTEKAQSYIDDFANESPMNLYEFIYINHDMLLSIQQKDTPVDCMLTFKGKFIDEELNFKRALIGTVLCWTGLQTPSSTIFFSKINQLFLT
jgi:hypothetical protein